MTLKVRKIKQPAETEQVTPDDERTPSVLRSVTLGDFTDKLARGLTKEQIVDELGLSTNQFESLLTRVFKEGESDHDMKTPLRHFLDYCIQSKAIARDLESCKNQLDGRDNQGEKKPNGKLVNAQAYVMACNAQVNILDRQLKVGQELGVIHKTPEGFMLIDGQDPRDFNEEELADAARREIAELEDYIDDGRGKKKKSGQVIAFKAAAGRVDR